MLPITLERETTPSYGRIADYLILRLPIAGKGSLAILDQALISGSNFLIGILLARWLVPAQYGAYATAYSIFLLVSLVYQALLLEPQSVFGPSEYIHRQRNYLGSLFWLHGVLASLIVLMLGVWAWVGYKTEWSPLLSGAFIGVIAATPFILLFWLVRGACYARLAPVRALEGAVPYCILVLLSLFVVYRNALMSPFVAFLLMAGGSFAASSFVLLRFQPSLVFPEQSVNLSTVSRQHWNYGRWALATSFVVWIPGNIYYAVLGRYSGLAEAGELRALLNLFVPLGHLLNALTKVLLPYAAGKHGLYGRAGALGRAFKTMFFFVCAAFAYWAMVIPFQRPILRLLYNGRFTNIAFLIPCLGLASILSFATLSAAISLRAMQEPSSVFIVYAVASTICLVVGVPLAMAFGLRGVVVGLNASSLGGLVTGIALVRAKAMAHSQA